MPIERNETDLLFAGNRSVVAEARRLAPSLDGAREVEGLLEEREGLLLYVLARRAGEIGNVVEIGSYKGRSTWYLAKGLEDAASRYRVVALDPHLEGTEQDFRANLERTGIGPRVDARTAYAEEVVGTFTDEIGLLWIDGDHAYAAVRRDFEQWFPRLRAGGWIAFHDTVNHWHGPTRLARELLGRRDDLSDIGVIGSITFARKTTPATRNRIEGMAARLGFEIATLVRSLRVGFGPRNAVPGER
jgi:predicted O-methyltransferase YrrM